jgi:PEP-CTERM motif-containing protein
VRTGDAFNMSMTPRRDSRVGRCRPVVFFAAIAVTLFLTRSAGAAPLTVNFSNIPGGSISFVTTADGATFSFPPQPGNDFSVTSVANFTSGVDLTGLLGDITGVFGYKTADILDLGGGVQQANVTPVTPTGNEFVIHDGGGHDFTADLLWNTITTIAPGGGVDLTATLNLTNFQYAGANAALTELRQAGTGSVSATFTFTPIQYDLQGLTTQCGAGCSTSFSGTMTATGQTTPVPEPGSYVLLLVGLVAIVGMKNRLDVRQLTSKVSGGAL